MKRLFKPAIYAIAMLAAAGCTSDPAENVNPDNAGDKGKVKLTVRASLPADDTRVIIGEKDQTSHYPLLWQPSGERIGLFEFNEDNGYLSTWLNYVCEAYAVSSDGRSACFDYSFDKQSGSAFRYYGVYPADNTVLSYFYADDVVADFEWYHPRRQTPLAASADPSAILMYAVSDSYDSQPESIDLQFKHILAYAKMTIDGLALDDDEKVEAVTFGMPEDKPLTGSYEYAYRYSDGKTGTSITPSSYSNDIIINTENSVFGDEGLDVWFSTIPVSDITEFIVMVFTNKASYEMLFKVPASHGDFSLEQGVVSRFVVDMTDAYEYRTAANKIYYTTDDGKPCGTINEYGLPKGTILVSNVYDSETGTGVLNFSRYLWTISQMFGSNTENITTLRFPDSVTNIESSSVLCPKLESVYGPFTSDDHRSVVVNGSLRLIAQGGISEYTLPAEVASLDRTSVIAMNENFKSLIINDNVTYISDGAFICATPLSVYFTGKTPPAMGEPGIVMSGDCTFYVPYQYYDEWLRGGNWGNVTPVAYDYERGEVWK